MSVEQPESRQDEIELLMALSDHFKSLGHLTRLVLPLPHDNELKLGVWYGSRPIYMKLIDEHISVRNSRVGIYAHEHRVPLIDGGDFLVRLNETFEKVGRLSH